MFELKLDEEQVRKVRLYIENAKTELPKIMKQALNRASSMTRTYQSQLIRLGYHVKAEVVRGKIQFKSSTNELKSYIVQSKKRVALEKFNINFKRPGTYKKRFIVSVRKESRHTVPGLFWAHYKTEKGKVGLYYRAGTERSTLQKAYGPSAYQMALTKQDMTKKVHEYAQEKFKDRFEHEFIRRLKR
ncbi:hypothetical protein FUSO7_01000 [Fusobacterium necrophorum BFTR-2]|uniref:hypothetical protein n=1 Tax=Fusobacterium necrophorum TaxID=859 RepID=UPI000460E2D0|nr:hypothetical protein [Fusobacterium necrophorum]KDE74809.1 hypothetical protein FUSO7_01000 [Fusobacterium necrophorum BFTR-2]